MIVRLTPPVHVPLEGDLAKIDELKAQWKTVPYTASVPTEASKAMSLFKSPELSKPSVVADLPQELAKKSFAIQFIDNDYVSALEEYKTSFINATALDFAVSVTPRDTALDFHLAMATGAARFAASTPNIAVIKHLVGPLLVFIGSIYGMVNQKNITDERVDEERSLHRSKWFSEVVVKEEMRIKSAVKVIAQRVKIIQRDMEGLDDGLVDDGLVDELKVLDTFTTFLSPDTPLKVNDVSALEYLRQRGIDVGQSVEDFIFL